MLPYFPKSHEQMIEIRDENMWIGYYSVSPVLSKIRMRQQHEGKSSTVQNEQGRVERIDYQKKSVTIQRHLEEARGMTTQEFIQTAREPGIGMGRETMRGIYEMLERVTKETGNIVNAGGKPLTYDLFLELLEKIQIDFSGDGSPIWPSLNLGSEAHAHFKAQWPEWVKNPEFTNRLRGIIEKKREEFYAREACRRLVD